MSQGFDPKDLEEICSRKPTKFKMKKADYKELGRNTLLGSVDLVFGALGAAVLTVGALNNSNKVISKSESDDLGYGYKDGNQGYGYYFGDIKDDD
ncbi:hypothetical protein [Serratia marcescens]|uniref:hypothetical protein n=1 Tax=Enterobacterales TaxID=91347 RepID=UPI000931610F|nr:hypothetical protein [Serratia marcescens]